MATVQTFIVANPTPNAIALANSTPASVPAGETVEVALSTADSGGLAVAIEQGLIVASGPLNTLAGGANLALSSALTTGSAITALPVVATTEVIPAGSSIVLETTDGAHTQTVVTSARASVGATSLTITSATPNFAYTTAATTVTVEPLDPLHNIVELVEKGADQLLKMVHPIVSANGDTWGVKGLYQGASSGFVSGGN